MDLLHELESNQGLARVTGMPCGAHHRIMEPGGLNVEPQCSLRLGNPLLQIGSNPLYNGDPRDSHSVVIYIWDFAQTMIRWSVYQGRYS